MSGGESPFPPQALAFERGACCASIAVGESSITTLCPAAQHVYEYRMAETVRHRAGPQLQPLCGVVNCCCQEAGGSAALANSAYCCCDALLHVRGVADHLHLIDPTFPWHSVLSLVHLTNDRAVTFATASYLETAVVTL